MRRFFMPIIEALRGRNPGRTGAVTGFCLALLLVLFGFWRTLFILLMTFGGYYIGVRFFANLEVFRQWLDRLLPPGRFR